MLARARTFAIVGVDALAVDAEVDIHRGLPAFSVVGLPDPAVRESRERVRAAIVNSGFDFPQKRITVSLAPSGLRKAGPGFDLAIASGILVASGQLPRGLLDQWALAGELALDGRLRPVRGVLAMADAARRVGSAGIVVPAEDHDQAALIEGVAIAPLVALADLGALARGEIADRIDAGGRERRSSAAQDGPRDASSGDIADLRGQPALRHALELAAAGGHSLLVIGPPGAGKSLAARRLPSILPPLDPQEVIEVMRIAGVAGLDRRADARERPFRAPHHTISAAGLVGGGSPPRPGEISLAHRGVLFLDELAEFQRGALEALRQPLEDGEVTISRAGGSLRLPARFQLLAAANPCPCGRGAEDQSCSCGPEQLRRYRSRLSGALADRIDIVLGVGQPRAEALAGDSPDNSERVGRRVLAARARQAARQGARTNAELADSELLGRARLTTAGAEALEQGQRVHRLSGRGWARALRLARTEADLAGNDATDAREVHAALLHRSRLGSD